jgi:hypothetical protein
MVGWGVIFTNPPNSSFSNTRRDVIHELYKNQTYRNILSTERIYLKFKKRILKWWLFFKDSAKFVRQKTAEEDALFCLIKDGTFFPLFIDNEHGLEITLGGHG